MNKEQAQVDDLDYINDLKAGITENALFTRDHQIENIKTTNEALDKLSTELGIISSILFGLIAAFFERLSPTSREERILLFILSLILITSSIFALINKYIIYIFWKKSIPLANERAAIWMKARNQLNHINIDIEKLYSQAVEEEKVLLLGQKKESADWPVNTQIITLVISVVLVVIYLTFKFTVF